MTSHRLAALLFASFVLLTTFGLTPAASQTVFPKPGDNVVGLYVAGAALGGVMSPDAPEGETSTKKSLIASAINPGLGTVVLLGSFTPAEDVTFTSDVGVTLWLVADTAMVYDQIQARLVGTGLTSVTANTPLTAPVAVQTTPTQLRLGLPAMGQTVKAGTKVNFEAVLFGVAAAGTPTDLFLLYASKTHPSGIVFSTTAAAAFPTANSARIAYLADKSLTSEVPSGTTDKSATIAGSTCTGNCMVSVPAWTWGKMTAEEDFTVTGNAVLTIWVSVPAGAMRGFSATLNLGGTAFGTSQGGTITRTWTSPSVVKFVFVFPTNGAQVAAGKDITLGFQAWTTADSAGDMRILFGSEARPSGVMIPVAGAAAEEPALPSVLLVAESLELTGPEGGAAVGQLQLVNNGTSEANVTVNATGDLPVQFEAETYTLAGGASSNVSFRADLANATAGQSFSFTLRAFVEDVEIGNLTFTVLATAPEAPTSGDGAVNATASASASIKAKEQSAIPGIGWTPLLLTLSLAAFVLRRRRAED